MVLEGNPQLELHVTGHRSPKHDVMLMAWSPRIQGNLGLSFSLHIPTVFRNTFPSVHLVLLVYGVAKFLLLCGEKYLL